MLKKEGMVELPLARETRTVLRLPGASIRLECPNNTQMELRVERKPWNRVVVESTLMSSREAMENQT